MVKKSKEDAELTRKRIITAAREVFLSRGVSRTTLEHIATQANVTRGAIYWHFKNKTEIFQAIREQVLLPVSYTHLDVYKRQKMGRVIKNLVMSFILYLLADFGLQDLIQT